MAKRTGEKYQAIIEAAIRVIARHGYYNAQVSKIAKEAGVADGTIYLYFESKEDVLISLFKEKMGRFNEQVRMRLDTTYTVEEKLKAVVSVHLEQMSKNPDYAVVTQMELRQSDPVIQEKIGPILKSYFNLIDQVIAEGKETAVFSKEVDHRLCRQMVFGTLDQVVTTWIFKGAKYDLTASIEPVCELLLYGLKGNAPDVPV